MACLQLESKRQLETQYGKLAEPSMLCIPSAWHAKLSAWVGLGLQSAVVLCLTLIVASGLSADREKDGLTSGQQPPASGVLFVLAVLGA